MMKKKYILSFIFSIFLISNFSLNAQKIGLKGIGVGVDISRYVMHIVNNNLNENEFNLELSIHENFDLLVEIGNSNSIIEKYSYNYNVNGMFQRYGVNYHILNEKTDNIYIGGRIGHCNFNRNISSAEVYNDFWNTSYFNFPDKSINTYWLEFVAGLKVELIKNLYLGWDIRLKAPVYKTKDELMDIVYIPGYGKLNSKIGAGFSYRIFYRLPF